MLNRLWWIFAVLGLIFIFISTILPYDNKSLFLSPLMWEQLGFWSFIASPVSLWLGATQSKNLFNQKNSGRFYHNLLRTVSTGKTDDIEIVITFIIDNLDKLSNAIKMVEGYPFSKSVPKELTYCLHAQELVNVILSDEQVANYVVTTRIDFLFYFFKIVKDKGLTHRTLDIGVDKIINQLFENNESYLYKQLNYDGLSLYAPIYEVIFGDLYFINSFYVLKKWHLRTTKEVKDVDRYAQVFVKALEEAIKASKFEDQSACDEISYVLYQLVDFSGIILKKYQKDNTAFSDGFWNIEHFFGNTFPELFRKAVEDKTVNDYELQSNKGDRYRQSLTASYAEALEELLGEISRADNRDRERHQAMGATEQILSIIDTDELFNNIRKCVLENIWEQIDDNVKRGHFPAVLRIYIEIMYWKSDNLPTWYVSERAKLINYLYKELAPRIESGELMANFKDTKEKELLPSTITYDRESRKYFIINRDGTRSELI